MNSPTETNFDWMSSYIALITLVQFVLVAYWWRKKIRPLPFVLAGLIALVVWAILLSMPFESHAVKIDLPDSEPSASFESVATAFTMVTMSLLVVGINQLIFLSIRVVVNRL